MTKNEIRAATAAVRSYVDSFAGWYSSMVSNEHCRGLAMAALAAAEKERQDLIAIAEAAEKKKSKQ